METEVTEATNRTDRGFILRISDENCKTIDTVRIPRYQPIDDKLLEGLLCWFVSHVTPGGRDE